MMIVASLLFAIALFAAIGAIVMTVDKAMPRIHEVISAEFSPAAMPERRIILGAMVGPRSAEVIAFPRASAFATDLKMAA